MEIGKLKKQQEDMRGWLCGQFFPKDSPFHDDAVEIYCKELPVGDIGDKLHVHPHGNEYMIVMKGRLRIQLGNEIVELASGDYIATPQGTPECILNVLEPTTIVGCHYPSVPNNKEFIS